MYALGFWHKADRLHSESPNKVNILVFLLFSGIKTLTSGHYELENGLLSVMYLKRLPQCECLCMGGKREKKETSRAFIIYTSILALKNIILTTEMHQAALWKTTLITQTRANGWPLYFRVLCGVLEKMEDIWNHFFNACRFYRAEQPAVFKVGHSFSCFPKSVKVRIEVWGKKIKPCRDLSPVLLSGS